MRAGAQVVLAAAAVVATAVLAAGCGGSKSGPGVAQIGTVAGTNAASTTAKQPTRADFQTAILAYTRCMRANGIEMADPTFNGGGGGGFFRAQTGINRNSAKFRAAQTKCGAKLAAIRPQFTPQQQQQFQATALKFAQCMRKNGVSVPDPTFNGNGGGGGLFGGSGLRRDDPKVQKATQACRHVFTDAGLGRGPGGRGGGFFAGPPPGGGG